MSLAFKFYSVIKNEDTLPYYDDNIIVIADGMGGAGGYKHIIEKKDMDCFKTGVELAAFGDCVTANEKYNEYIGQLLQPMLDEEDDTSALWASRIVSGRAVYALTQSDKFAKCDLSDEKTREELVNFITLGLKETAKSFELEKRGQKLLPTTLVVMKYTQSKSAVTVDVVWAGDSRCYALNQKGAVLLSRDDEDPTGALTNLFCADEGYSTHLNFKRVTLKKPCALFAVSDGLFDPFDPYASLGVEAILCDRIMQSDSVEELEKNYHDLFRAHYVADDSSMAFVGFGYDDLADFKKKNAKRIEYVLQTWEKYENLNRKLAVIAKPEQEVKSYIITRTRDKLASIKAKINELLADGTPDMIVDEAMVEQARAASKKAAEAIAGGKAEYQNEKIVAVTDAMKDDKSLVVQYLSETSRKIRTPHSGDVVIDIRRICEGIDINTACANDAQDNIDALITERERFISEMWEEIDEKYQGIKELQSSDDEERFESINIKAKAIARHARLALLVTDEKPVPKHYTDVIDLKDDEKAGWLNMVAMAKNYVSSIRAQREVLKSIQAKMETQTKNLELLLVELQTYLLNERKDGDVESVFTLAAEQEYDLLAKNFKHAEPISAAVGIAMSDDELVEYVVEKIIKNSDKISAIDGCYNKARLASTRLYYSVLNERAELDSFNQQLTEIEAAYEQEL